MHSEAKVKGEIFRLIGNRFYEGMHPVKRHSVGLGGLAKAVLLAEGLDPAGVSAVLTELKGLAANTTCAKCRCKVLLFARELARAREPDADEPFDRAARALAGIPFPIGNVIFEDVEHEILLVMQAVREDPDIVTVA